MPIKDAINPIVIVRELVKEFGITLSRTSEGRSIVGFLRAKTRVTPRIANKLSIIFPHTDLLFWLNMQRDYDISKFLRDARNGCE